MGGGKAIDLGFSILAELLEIVLDASGGLLTVSLVWKAMLACVRDRGGKGSGFWGGCTR